MASVIQHTGNVAFGSSATFAVSFGVTPSVGNFVVAQPFTRGGNISYLSMADNQAGNTYNTVTTTNNGSGCGAIVLALINVASGTFTVTATFNGTPSSYGMVISEVNGITGAVDQKISTAFTTNTTFSINNAGANSGANDIVFAQLTGTNGFTTASGLTDPPSAGYTSLGFFDGTGSYQGAADLGYKIISALETDSASWTSTTSLSGVMAIASFPSAATVAWLT